MTRSALWRLTVAVAALSVMRCDGGPPAPMPQRAVVAASLEQSAPLDEALPVPAARPASARRPAAERGVDAMPLAPFFRRLSALAEGQSRAPVTILQIGDSHTANDGFSGRLRRRLQERFGTAGRGMLPPGVPFKYYRPTQVAASQGDGWTVQSSFDAKASGAFGLTGFRAHAEAPGQAMTLDLTDEGESADSVAVEALMQPGGGTLDIAVDGRPVYALGTAARSPRAGLLKLRLPTGGRRLQLTTRGDGPVDLLSWALERSGAGIILDSEGIVGTTVNIIGRWDPTLIAFEASWRAPALIILAFGTNEAWDDKLDPEKYRLDYAAKLALLRQVAPDAAILVVAPPDGNRRVPGCAGKPARNLCAPDPAAARCGWSPPGNLAVVREIQRRLAAENNAEYWDWSQAMGGACSMHRWVTHDPPLAFPDHVHLRRDGYAMTADVLFDTLMAEYDQYRRGAAPAQALAAPQ